MTNSSMTAGTAADSFTSSQARLHALVRTDLEALDRSLRELVAPLTSTERRRVPPAGGWHVDAVCEHLCLANEHYLRAMSAALDVAAGSAPDAAQHAWRPTFAGRFLVHALVSHRRMPRPPVLTPGPEPRPGVLEALLATHDALRALLQRSEGVAWRRVRFSSPFARLIRLNLGDGALVIVRHSERHARQIARIRSALAT